MDIREVSSIEELEKLLYTTNPQDSESEESDTPDPLEDDGEDSPETPELQEAEEPSDEEKLRNQLLTLTPEQILAMHPGVAGKVGALGDKRGKEIAAQRLEELRREEEAQRLQDEEDALIELAETDPEAAGRATRERLLTNKKQKLTEAERLSRQQEYGAELAAEMDAIYKTPIMAELAEHMTDDQIVALYWKNGQYSGFADWAEGMLKTVREYAREEGRKEALASAGKTDSQPKPRVQRARPAILDIPGNLDTSSDEVGEYQPSTVKKMDWQNYAANRDAILKSIKEE